MADIMAETVSAEERLPMRLRALYRSYGYTIYKLNNFEPYDLYRENRNFLVNGKVLTFTDSNGRLLALRPDVTISVVKDTKPEQASRKLFYSEHVFRRLKGAEQFSEIKQMGLEFIGAGPGYAEAEVTALALQSLAAVRGPAEPDAYFLSVSHMDYVGALLGELPEQEGLRERLMDAIRHKSVSDIRLALAGLPIGETLGQALLALISLPPQPDRALRAMARISVNRAMEQACRELAELLKTLEAWGLPRRLRIDLSLLNDFDYYNGLIFHGYLRGLPRPVLSGGRYDKMMRRFDKPQPAMGFALYLNELQPALATRSDYDVDTLLLYGDQPPAEVARAVRDLVSRGVSVRAEREAPQGLRARRILRLGEEEP